MAAADAGEFEAATARHRRELLAHCYRLTGSAAEAEDIVQDTYLRAWQASSRFEGRSSVRTWLYRIATNACLTHLERRSWRALPRPMSSRPGRASASPWWPPSRSFRRVSQPPSTRVTRSA